MDRGRGVVDVGNRAGRRHGLQVAVVDAVAGDIVLQLRPLLRRRHGDVGVGKQLLDLVGFGLEVLRVVAVEELARGVLGLGKIRERGALLHGDLVGGPQALVHHGGEVGVGEVQAFLGAVFDVLAAEVAVQVHLAQADGVGGVVAVAHRRHGVDGGLVRHCGQRADGGLDGFGEVVGVHRHRDVQRAQVAGDVVAGLGVGQVFVQH